MRVNLLVSCLLFVFSMVEAQDLDPSLLKEYGPNKKEFLSLCAPYIDGPNERLVSSNACFLYFVGLHNGYLFGDKKGTDRAVLYYALDGEVEPAGDLNGEYWLKAKGAFDTKAFAALDAHKVTCMRKVPTEKLLRNFYAFLEKARRNNGVTLYFDEFVQTAYAGKC